MSRDRWQSAQISSGFYRVADIALWKNPASRIIRSASMLMTLGYIKALL